MKRIKIHVDRPARRPLGSQNSVEFDPFRQATVELQVPNFNIPEGVPPPPPPTGPNDDISIDGQGNPTIEVVQTPDPTSGGDVGDGIDIDIELPDAVLVGDTFNFKVTFDPDKFQPNTTYNFRIKGLESDEIRLIQQNLGSWTFNQNALVGTFKTDAFFPQNVVSAQFIYFKDPNSPDQNREGTFTITGEDASKTIIFAKAAVESELNFNLSSNSEFVPLPDGILRQRWVYENEIYSLKLTEPDKDRILSYEVPITIDGNSEQDKNWFFSDVNGNPLDVQPTSFSLNNDNNYEDTLYFKIADDGVGEYPTLLKFDIFNPTNNDTSSIKFFLREPDATPPTTGQVGYVQDSPIDYTKFVNFGDTIEFVHHIQKRETTRVPEGNLDTSGAVTPYYSVSGVGLAIDADSPNNSSGITNAEQGGVNSLQEGVHYDYVDENDNVISKPELLFNEQNDYSVTTRVRLKSASEVGELCDNVIFLRILRGLNDQNEVVGFTPGYNVPYRRLKNTINKIQYENLWTPDELGSELKAWYRPETITSETNGWSNSISVTGLFDMENSSGSSLPIKLIDFQFPNDVVSDTWLLDPSNADNETGQGGPFDGQYFTIDTEEVNTADNPFAIPTDVAVFNVSLSPFSVDYFNPTLVSPLILAQANAPENSFPGELQWNLFHTLLSVGDFGDITSFPNYAITDMSMYGNVPISNYPGQAYTGARIKVERELDSGETFVVDRAYGGGVGEAVYQPPLANAKGNFTSCPMTIPQANAAVHSIVFRKNFLADTGLPADTTSYPDPTIWGRGNGQTVLNYPTPEFNNVDAYTGFGNSVNQVNVFRKKVGQDFEYGASMVPEIIIVQAKNIDEETGGVISDDTVFRIEGYLAHKYNTYPLLPDGHPYKNTPPLLGD